MNYPALEEVLLEAQRIPMWIMALLVVGLVALQALLFASLARKFSDRTGVMSKEEQVAALKTGAISAIGPAMGIFIIAVGLITRLGAPVTLMRIGVIGSAQYELRAATFGAQACGVDLGGAGYNYQAMTNAVWTMCLCGTGWLLFTGLCTKSLDSIRNKMVESDPKLLGVIGAAASLGAVSYLVGQQGRRGVDFTVALIASGLTMLILQKLAKRESMKWIREWSLGFAMIAGMFVASVIFR